MPSPQTLARVEAEGLAALHRPPPPRRRRCPRRGEVLTGRGWVRGRAPPRTSSPPPPLPEGLDAAPVLAAAAPGHALSAGVGPAGERLVRLNHTGPRARLDVVLGDLAALGRALSALGLPVDVGAALAAAEAAEASQIHSG